MLRYLTVAALLLSNIALPLAAQRPVSFVRVWAPVRDHFQQSLKAEGVVGGALLVFRGDSILAHETYGFADLETRRPVTPSTIFHWASITKTFTAVAIAQLQERGRLTFDDPVIRHVPELRAVHNPFGPMDAITLRQLLSHSAGFRDGTWPYAAGKPWEPFEPTSWSQLVAMMPYTEVLFPPGSKFSYSNPGYIYLGRTIEGLTGEDYETYMEKNVLRPLGMHASYFDRTPYHLLGERSNNYSVAGDQVTANGLDFDTGITVSNGGLNAPLTDLVRFLQLLVDAPRRSAAARGVISPATVQTLWRGAVPIGGTAADSLGLGFFLVTRDGLRLVGHTGSQAAFRSFFHLDPVSKSGVIFVINTAPSDDPRNPTDQGPGRPRIGELFNGILTRITREVFPALRP